MRPVIASLAAALAACTTVPAVSPSLRLPPESRAECEAHCGQLGMHLGAVVIIRNSIGCVCEPTQATAAPAPVSVSGTGVASGAAVHAMLAEAEQQRGQQFEALHSKSMSTTPSVPTPGAHGLSP